MKVYSIAQRGVIDSRTLSEFIAAAISDVTAGRGELREMILLRSYAGLIVAHENLKYKAGLYKQKGKPNFLSA